MTVSDTRTMETDTSGALIVALAEEAGHRVLERHIVPDEPAEMSPLFQAFCSRDDLARDPGHGRNRHQPARPDL